MEQYFGGKLGYLQEKVEGLQPPPAYSFLLGDHNGVTLLFSIGDAIAFGLFALVERGEGGESFTPPTRVLKFCCNISSEHCQIDILFLVFNSNREAVFTYKCR